ncbi:D-ribose-binding periplasmic protein precursor [Pirellulimonas nuda]|uniref:D-ribose-binding periplasmic protein n=1 Tax=Pirellulimonas nuda TaxID=2528009 RepID=A0A518DG20_9BACT|nr:substrate-binding domain-containing protein [Pirellulimonas nuda]QDU90433.1 D-ribose-binding periplasmic protein precursor [Pirellulimonas nuda]
MLSKGAFWTIAVVAVLAAGWYRLNAASETTPLPSPAKIAFVTGGSGDYWEASAAGARAAAKELGIELDVRMPSQSENVEEQMKLLSAVGAGGVDGVAVSPLDAEGQTPLINTIAKDRPVVTFDSDAPLSARNGYVGTSNFSAGLVAGTLVKKALPDGGKVVVLIANLTKNNLIDRKVGFKTRIDESPNPEADATDPRYKVIGYLVDDGDDKKCEENIRSALAENEDLACFVGMNARHAPILLRVLKEDGWLNKVRLVTFDTLPETLDGIEQGYISATVAQDPYKYGYEAVNMLNSLCRGDVRFMPVVGRGAIHVSVEPITNETLPQFREAMNTRMAQSKAEDAPAKTKG